MSNSPIPKRIKEARVAKKIPQRQLGLRVGFELTVASSRMNQYEKGKRVPDFGTLEKIAEELGVPVAYFFCTSDKMADLLKFFGDLPESEQEKLLADLHQKTDVKD